ncbi:hypothetical protein E2320_015030, partial [Naja naja]
MDTSDSVALSQKPKQKGQRIRSILESFIPLIQRVRM